MQMRSFVCRARPFVRRSHANGLIEYANWPIKYANGMIIIIMIFFSLVIFCCCCNVWPQSTRVVHLASGCQCGRYGRAGIEGRCPGSVELDDPQPHSVPHGAGSARKGESGRVERKVYISFRNPQGSSAVRFPHRQGINNYRFACALMMTNHVPLGNNFPH